MAIDMTRYEDLSAKAVALAGRFNRIEQLCEFKAGATVRRIESRLQAPDGRVFGLEVDKDLVAIHDSAVAPGPVKVRQGRDGRWYFAVRVTYGNPRGAAWLVETMVLGIRALDDDVARMRIGLLEEQEYDVDNDAALDSFIDRVLQDTEERIVHGFMRDRGRIGFST